MTQERTSNTSTRDQLVQLSRRVPIWLARLAPPWGPVADEHIPDLAQEVLVAAVAGLSRYDPAKGSLGVWLYVITRRMARDHRQREDYRSDFTDDADVTILPVGTRNPEEAMATAQYERLVHETIGEMDEDLREVLTAVELAELSYEETAQLIGGSKRTVKDRLERARQDFSRRIKRKMRDRGLVVLPFAVDGLFAFLRARTEQVPEDQLAQLRAIVEQSPASGARPAVPDAAPNADAPTSGGSDVGSFVGGNFTGGLVGGAIVYLLMQTASAPVPVAARAQFDERVPHVPTVDAMPMQQPIMPPAATPRKLLAGHPPADPLLEARALLDRARGALERGDIADAREALARYDRRFPANPFPKVRAALLGKIVKAAR
ncbi:RNA polymerase sigma factor [Polyangium mundeleinium]|uniref:Sigma-70 family RNA polymerase sigma factor n=1 Tax=Polyangium mundeleinium TaxID=2995306 RepID=A0ABT5F5G2_9BACT|nr:sigma-70 family RNA polymerase sigma factor [Polyangium mundeleinium]MDC0749191.1 sigma-70 family RNA polymerase sigma factor [Polyangium mundeleinium]